MNRKRVLIYTETALAASETFIADHCRSLKRWDYTLLALSSSGAHHSDVPRSLVYERPPGRIDKLLFRMGICRRLDAAIGRVQPDLIHAHFITNGAFIRAYAKRHGVPLIVTAHGYDVTRKLRFNALYDLAYRWQRRWLKRDVAMLLSASNFLEKRLLSLGFSHRRIQTHYLGIPIAVELPGETPSAPARIVFVGRLIANKGIDTVLSALARLRRSHPLVELHIVGDGPLRPLVEQAARELGKIVWYGTQSPECTRGIIDTAALLTLPSRQAENGESEGFGLVLLEAQARGVPVVTTNRTGTMEAIVDGQTGLAIDPDDPEKLAAAFTFLLDNPEEARRMGTTGVQHVRANFDIAKQSGKLEAIYDDVLASLGERRGRP